MSASTGSRSSSSMTGYKPQFNVGKSKGGYQSAQLQQFTPEQIKLFSRSFGNVDPNSFNARLAAGDEDIFNQVEAPAMRQFAGLQGNIASRFSGMGSGARHSSGFQNTMNQASSDFASNLQSQRLGLQQNAIQNLHQMSMDLLGQRPFENGFIQKQPGFLEKLFGSLLGAGGQFGAGKFFGGF